VLPDGGCTIVPVMKELTRGQIAARQEKAVQFTDKVRDDPDRADEIADMTVEEYAQERGFKVVNPTGRRRTLMPKTRSELIQENRELKEQLAEVEDRLDQVADLVLPDDDEGEEGEEGEE